MHGLQTRERVVTCVRCAVENAAAAQLVEVEYLPRVAIECALAGIFPVVVLSPDAAATAIGRHAGFRRHAGADEEHGGAEVGECDWLDRKSTRLNSSH